MVLFQIREFFDVNTLLSQFLHAVFRLRDRLVDLGCPAFALPSLLAQICDQSLNRIENFDLNPLFKLCDSAVLIVFQSLELVIAVLDFTLNFVEGSRAEIRGLLD